MQSVSTIINGKSCTVSKLDNLPGFVRIEYGNQNIILNPEEFGAVKAKCATILFEVGRLPEFAVTDPIAMREFIERQRKRSAAAYYERERLASL